MSVARAGGSERYEFLSVRSLALVFIGGTLGTYMRALIGVGYGPGGDLYTIATVNIVGAYCMGILVGFVGSAPQEGSTNARWSLLLGTGFLGGFTTYSAFALVVALMVSQGGIWLATAFGFGMVVLGAVATIAGLGVVKLFKAGDAA